MVIGDDSCSRGGGFKSQHCILDGHDIIQIDLLIKLYCLFGKRPKINKKEAGVGPFLKKHSEITPTFVRVAVDRSENLLKEARATPTHQIYQRPL